MEGKILLIGFSDREFQKVANAIGKSRLFAVPEYCRDWVVEEVVTKAEELKGPSDWHLRKFVIMHELDNETLKEVIRSVKALHFDRVIFATTTETSLTWKLEDLLEELMAEDNYFHSMQWARKEASRRKRLFLDFGKG